MVLVWAKRKEETMITFLSDQHTAATPTTDADLFEVDHHQSFISEGAHEYVIHEALEKIVKGMPIDPSEQKPLQKGNIFKAPVYGIQALAAEALAAGLAKMFYLRPAEDKPGIHIRAGFGGIGASLTRGVWRIHNTAWGCYRSAPWALKGEASRRLQKLSGLQNPWACRQVIELAITVSYCSLQTHRQGGRYQLPELYGRSPYYKLPVANEAAKALSIAEMAEEQLRQAQADPKKEAHRVHNLMETCFLTVTQTELPEDTPESIRKLLLDILDRIRRAEIAAFELLSQHDLCEPDRMCSCRRRLQTGPSL